MALPPGSESRSSTLEQRLEDAVRARGPSYKPRTRHKQPDGSARYTNRLALEQSPYLLQHAHNPVDWYPWGDDAFAAARRLGRPVFLSIGYSTCHWCHVMEEESFEDEEVARFLNERYIAVKVDREERPDVDAIYMAAVQALTGHGGWPMSVWLTSERKPYFTGTYFPARDGDRGTRFGFLTILERMRDIFDRDPARVTSSAEQIADAVREELSAGRSGDVPGQEALDAAMRLYAQRFDPVYGGLAVQTKFPSQLSIRFLLRYARRRQAPPEQRRRALDMARLTLEKMARGGVYDHAGGGFHRYSVDPYWLVPHFEKMLYDNALLCVAYLEGGQASGDRELLDVAREILRYVERDMTSPEGAFYSATDADSLSPSGEREEGWFFTWTPEELAAELGSERAGRVAAYFGVTREGNFEGRSILHTPRPLDEVARELGVKSDELREDVAFARERLYEARKERPAPLRDEKILTAWNGLMISACARGGFVLDDARWIELGEAAAAYVLEHMRDGERLYRSSMDGTPRHAAYLDDYAFLCAGLLDLFEVTGTRRWLSEALALDRVLEQHFEDAREGGYFMTADDAEALLVREKPAYDGAEPSGNSIHAQSLVRLHALSGDDRYRQRAERTFRAFGEVLVRSPLSLAESLVALDHFTDEDAKEIVLVGPEEPGSLRPLLDEVRRRFLPNQVLVSVREPDVAALSSLLPVVSGRLAKGGAPTAYVCVRGTCQLPSTDPAELGRQLDETLTP